MTALCDSCKRLIQEKDAAQRQVVELRSDVKQAASLDTKMTELREKLREEQMHCERQQSDNATRLNKLEYLLSEERQHRKNLEHKFEENGILDSKTLRDIFGKSRLHAEMSKQQIERPVDMIANCRKLAAKEILGFSLHMSEHSLKRSGRKRLVRQREAALLLEEKDVGDSVFPLGLLHFEMYTVCCACKEPASRQRFFFFTSPRGTHVER
ncbi:uncharacterized protein LOC142775021 [Rhipicephalus microplus]|uniref:uncharacterized protein LOC142775021 n=1 Tax=Rhipicephalus microplus TaxID=6941 RepID=UPI003F6D863A